MGHRRAERWVSLGSNHLDQEAPHGHDPFHAIACAAPSTVFAALELSRSMWLVALRSPISDRVSQHRLEGDDIEGLIARKRG